MIPTKTLERISQAERTALLGASLAVILALALVFVPNDDELIQKNETSQAAPIKEATERKEMSPAQALSNEKPTLFFFYPVDTCRIRYCRQPVDVEVKLRYLYNDQINFVPVGVMAETYGPNPADTPQIPLSNWDVYPVEPYAEWLPLVLEPQMDASTASVTVALVDAAGDLVYGGGEFFSWEELDRHFDKVAKTSR